LKRGELVIGRTRAGRHAGLARLEGKDTNSDRKQSDWNISCKKEERVFRRAEKQAKISSSRLHEKKRWVTFRRFHERSTHSGSALEGKSFGERGEGNLEFVSKEKKIIELNVALLWDCGGAKLGEKRCILGLL